MTNFASRAGSLYYPGTARQTRQLPFLERAIPLILRGRNSPSPGRRVHRKMCTEKSPPSKGPYFDPATWGPAVAKTLRGFLACPRSAMRPEIALASSFRPACCKACASRKYPTSVGRTAAACEYWRMASARSPFCSAIKPSPIKAGSGRAPTWPPFRNTLCRRRVPHLPISEPQIGIGSRPHNHVGCVQRHHPIALDGGWHVAAAIFVGAQIHVGNRIVGTNGEGGAEVRRGVFRSALAE